MISTGQVTTIVRIRMLAVAAVCVLTLAVWATERMQSRASAEAITNGRAAQQMLIAMLDQQTGVRGFVLTRREVLLDPYRNGVEDFEDAVAVLRRLNDADMREHIDAQVSVAREWRALAEDNIARLRADPEAPASLGEVAGKRVFDRFRVLNSAFQAEVTREIDDQVRRTGNVAFATVLPLTGLFGLTGYVAIERVARRAQRRRQREEQHRRDQAEFAETMQVMRDELEAYDLVKHYLERSVAGARVTVLNRNNSDNRLHAATPVADDPELAEQLRDATPTSCLAIRLGRPFTRGDGQAPLLSCGLCATAPHVACIPSLVSGDVIGSVLLCHERQLTQEDIDRAGATVSQVAPVLANLRSLAIAETYAATDALTGLSNARACQDTLKRMVAHAGRTLSPLSALLLDLDHFKQINDRFGHGAGDDVLAAVGAVLQGAVRASDFAGRNGGEEFLMLLPDTDQQGALQVAEKVRKTISRIHMPQIDRVVTVSIGVATYPHDAVGGDTLLRQADRALYAAKAAGRNRVVVSMSPNGAPASPDGAPAITDATPPITDVAHTTGGEPASPDGTPPIADGAPTAGGAAQPPR